VENDEWNMNSKEEWNEPLKIELEHFAESILRGKQPHPSGEDGVKALRVVEAILKSLKQGKVVELDQ
ncbi:MAG: Gfo/Idh/MocA family oxidoreductase, partial [Candidatus Jordarchaeales archaeon]